MFSGIVRDVGTVVGATPEGNGRRLFVRSALPRAGSDAVALGDSISVNGACLTVDVLAKLSAPLLDVLADIQTLNNRPDHSRGLHFELALFDFFFRPHFAGWNVVQGCDDSGGS